MNMQKKYLDELEELITQQEVAQIEVGEIAAKIEATFAAIKTIHQKIEGCIQGDNKILARELKESSKTLIAVTADLIAEAKEILASIDALKKRQQDIISVEKFRIHLKS